MSVDSESERRFYVGERTETVKFVVNDSVEFQTEDGSRRGGAVVAIHSLKPDVRFVVEPGAEPWGDVVVAQSNMTLLE